MQPAAPAQGGHQRRERSEPCRQAAEEVKRALGAGQVESQQAAAALDERNKSGSTHKPHKANQLREKRRRGSKVSVRGRIDKMERNKHKSGGAGEEEKQNGKNQNRPASAQALAADQGPVHPAENARSQRGRNSLGCAGCARVRRGRRTFPRRGLNLWLHGASFKIKRILV